MKYLRLLLSMVLLALCLTACSKGGKDITVDVNALAQKLQAEAVTSDSLTATASEMLSSIYFVTDEQLAQGAAYMSSGATACEVVVIECKEASQTGDVEKLFKTRVANQSELFASYNAGEVTKLDSAIIKSAGKYAVLCVCDDTAKAESILKEAGF
ncbi:MAG: DUF4358 domain-containing protein [Lachnospiraceae bacterium]|nr:DUF4358 domain-containing protein [Lachnospiraceae bacterium]MDD3796573.1 DUF4358 domain-containing protein [Lachnospiraceae bacterium]